MSSLTLKLVSLAVRTAAKPIGNYIKRQAKEHEGFRGFAVGAAQAVHRLDMRMRLGLLHDAEAQQRMHEREKRAAEEKKRKAEMPTVRTAEEQKKYDEQKANEAVDEARGQQKGEEQKAHKPKIRPLTEARAIELGANFFSEAFIFGVAVGLLLWENWRSRSKASAQRDEISERVEQLEAEVVRLRTKLDPDLETLAHVSERAKDAKRRRQSWSGWVAGGLGLAGGSPEDSGTQEEEEKKEEEKKEEEEEEEEEEDRREKPPPPPPSPERLDSVQARTQGR